MKKTPTTAGSPRGTPRQQHGQNIMAVQSLALGLHAQQQLNRHWNKINNDEFAYTPYEKIGKVTANEVRAENASLGNSASEYLKKIFEQSQKEETPVNRMLKKKKIAAVGFGRGYDSLWLREATLAGLETWWIDVSDVAVENASVSLQKQYQELESDVWQKWRMSSPVIKKGEIQSVLAEPYTIDLDLSSVEIWYFCRVIGCMSTESAKIVLRQLGRASLSKEADQDKKNKIVIINAFHDCNPGIISRTSTLRPKKFIVENTALGAERPITVSSEASYSYFNKVVTAMTLMAI